jgi:tetratricopeptide (TPR) repeat protein
VLEACERIGDDYTLAQAWRLIGQLEGSALGRFGLAQEAWAHALEYAERGGYEAVKGECMGWLMIMAIFGPLPADKGIERCVEFFEKAGPDEKIRAFAQVEQAVLEAMRGDFDVARKLLAEGHRRFESLGLHIWAANNAQEGYFIEMLAGNPEGAAEMLRESYDELDRMGERGFASTIAGMLANALEAQRLDEEAIRFSRESERLSPADDNYSQALWRTALAKVLARQGKFERAEVLAREAVEVLQPEMIMARSYANLDLAVVLATAGRKNEAKAAATQAEAFFEAKGNLVSLAEARRILDDLG